MSGPLCCGDLLEVYRVRGLELVVFHDGRELSSTYFDNHRDLDVEASRLLVHATHAGAMFVYDEHKGLDDARKASARLIRAFHLVTEAERAERSVKS